MINQAIRLLQNRDFSGAARLLEQSLIKDFKNPQILTFLGYAYFNLSQPDKALEYVLAAQKIDEKIPLSHEVEGDIFLLKNEPSKAFAAFFHALVLEPYDQVLMEKFKCAFDESDAPDKVDFFPVEGIMAHCRSTGSLLRKFDWLAEGQTESGIPYIAELETVHTIGHTSRLFSAQMTYLVPDHELEMIDRSDIVSVTGMRNIFGCSLPATKEHKPLALALIPAKIELVEKCILFNHRASDNYFHWLLEVVPSWEMIQSTEDYKDLPVMVNAHMPEQHFQILQKLIGPERQVIRAKTAAHYHINRAVIPSNINQMIFDPLPTVSLCNGDLWFKTSTINFLRKHFAEQVKPSNGRKILLTRKSSVLKKRKMLNEKQVEQVFIKFNFELIDCGTLAFDEQVALFQSASIIAGASGASLSNLVFANQACKVLLMCSKGSSANVVYESLASAAGINEVITIMGQTSEGSKQNLQADYTLDCDELERILLGL